MAPASIVVPTYKRIAQTMRTIELLLASQDGETVMDLELIVADSTPDDALHDAVRAAFGQRVVYTRPPRPGIAANKNQGARIARHPILIFCDSDMEVSPDSVKRTLASLWQHPTAAAVGGTVLWRGGPMDGTPDRPRPEDRQYRRDDTVYVEAIYSRYIAIYKDVFWYVDGYDEQVFNMRGEGSDLSCRLWRQGYPLTYDTGIVVHHVYDTQESAAIRVPHPEWGVARDLLLLAYKYRMLGGEHPNFVATLRANFPEETRALDAFIKADRPRYPFPFLEVFTDQALLDRCLKHAASCIKPYRSKVF